MPPYPLCSLFSTEEELRNTQKLETGRTGKDNGLGKSSVGQRPFVGAKNLSRSIGLFAQGSISVQIAHHVC